MIASLDFLDAKRFFLDDDVIKGDFVGHPFRGNQWSDASGASTSRGEGTQQAGSSVNNPWGGTFSGDFNVHTGEFIVDEEGMNDFILRQHSDLSLTKGERNSVNGWQSYDYADINSVLRGTAQIESFDVVRREFIKTTIKDLTNILTKATLDQDVVVFRGINDEELMFEDTVEGDIITDSGFIATTLNPTISAGASMGFIEGERDFVNPLIFRILIPKGTPAFSAQKLSGETTAPNGPFMKPKPELLAEQGNTHGSEIVLPPNTRFKVVREQNIEFQRVLDLEVIPNA